MDGTALQGRAADQRSRPRRKRVLDGVPDELGIRPVRRDRVVEPVRLAHVGERKFCPAEARRGRDDRLQDGLHARARSHGRDDAQDIARRRKLLGKRELARRRRIYGSGLTLAARAPPHAIASPASAGAYGRLIR